MDDYGGEEAKQEKPKDGKETEETKKENLGHDEVGEEKILVFCSWFLQVL